MTRGLSFAASMMAVWALSGVDDYGLPIEGRPAERYLNTARIVGMEPVGVGITRPQKVTLSDGRLEAKAIWKRVDELRQGVSRSKSTGGFQFGFRDSYKYEIAAYELDKLLGLGLVPPTVPRTIGGDEGSLQLWVEGAFTEIDRQERKLHPRDSGRWSLDMYKVYLLNQLTYNTDTQNGHNILYDPDFRIYAIDNSRSFRLYRDLPDPDVLRRFSKPVLERLRNLDRATLEVKLGRWLNPDEIAALIERRQLIVERADALVAEWGASVVLY